MDDKNNDRPAIEVTPEMISAGVEELSGHWFDLSAPELERFRS